MKNNIAALLLGLAAIMASALYEMATYERYAFCFLWAKFC